MSGAQADPQELELARHTWSLGDYARIAEHLDPAAAELIGRIDAGPGRRVLDVACGSGNAALRAARTGADVVACDITGKMLEMGRQRAAREDLDVRFVFGDAQALPVATHSVDAAVSAFGTMFAPRPDRVAAELRRVVRPGGVVAFTSWSDHGFFGETGRAARAARAAADVAAGRRGVDPPIEPWGTIDLVRSWFDDASPQVDEVTLRWEAPSVDELLDHLDAHSGPFVATRTAMAPEFYAQARSQLADFITHDNRATPPAVHLEIPYLVTVLRLAR